MDCLFCNIVDKKIPANIVSSDERVIAFDDLHPKAPFHKLIIPRKHIATLNDLTKEDDGLIGHLLYTAKELAKLLGVSEQGYRVVLNCNEAGGQTVFHIHAHLLGGRVMQWPPG